VQHCLGGVAVHFQFDEDNIHSRAIVPITWFASRVTSLNALNESFGLYLSVDAANITALDLPSCTINLPLTCNSYNPWGSTDTSHCNCQ